MDQAKKLAEIPPPLLQSSIFTLPHPRLVSHPFPQPQMGTRWHIEWVEEIKALIFYHENQRKRREKEAEEKWFLQKKRRKKKKARPIDIPLRKPSWGRFWTVYTGNSNSYFNKPHHHIMPEKACRSPEHKFCMCQAALETPKLLVLYFVTP